MATSLEASATPSRSTERRAGALGRAITTTPTSSAAASALWTVVLADLERDPTISRANFATWLRGTQLLELHSDEYTVGAQHSFALEKLERSFRGAIEQALQRQTGRAAHVRFIVARDAGAERLPRTAPRPLPLKTDTREEPPPSIASQSGALSLQPSELSAGCSVLGPPSSVLPHQTFETFAVSRHNQFAYAAASAVADNPSFAYNPLVLFGAPRAGKTHLLHAIGRRVTGLRAGARVVYLPARTLAAEWLRCGAAATAFGAPREQYARADVLLFDDLQLLAALGPVGTGLQLEVAHLIAALLAADAQVVVASQASPRTLDGLHEALRSRLQAGLVAELGARLPAAPARAAAPVAAASELPPPRRRTSADDVLLAVAAHFGVPVETLRARRRDQEAVLPRQVAMYLLREETGASLSEIGARLGGRDHSTVWHGYEKVAGQLAGDPGLQADVAAVRQRLAAVRSGDELRAPAAAAAP